MILETSGYWIMAKKPDVTNNTVTWNQLGVVLLVVIALLSIVGTLFKGSIDTGFDSIKSQIRDLKDTELKNIKESISDVKGALERRMDKLDDRLTRMEFPPFKEKAASAGIKTSMAEFKQYQTKAASLGIVAPEYFPVRLNMGFNIASQGVLTDGTPYNLVYTVREVQKDAIQIVFDGSIGANKFVKNVIKLPLKIGYQISLNRFVGQMVGRTLPELTLAILARPTENTLILASGSPSTSS